MVFRKEKVVFTAGGTREFHVPTSVSMVKLEVKSGSVTVEGRLTQDSDYVQISGVKADLTKSAVAPQGITSFEVARYYQIRLSYSGTDPVISVML